MTANFEIRTCAVCGETVAFARGRGPACGCAALPKWAHASFAEAQALGFPKDELRRMAKLVAGRRASKASLEAWLGGSSAKPAPTGLASEVQKLMALGLTAEQAVQALIAFRK
jgi:hypothetical protein